MKNAKKANLLAYSLACFSILLSVPPALYTLQVGLGLFPELVLFRHLGSFYNSLYTPLIGFLTLIVLFVQINKQAARGIDTSRIDEN